MTFNQETTQKMWYPLLQKHFPSRRWTKYYKNILFYMHCINYGFKPSFIWDFGPESLTPNHLSHFLQDLKQSCLLCDDVAVITVDDNTCISRIHYLFESLKRAPILMDITKTEKEWVLMKNSNFLGDVTDQLKSIHLSQPNDILALQLKSTDCLPSIFGLLLGYPLIYYFNSNYSNFSVSLMLYRVICRFEFLNISDEFEVSSFSIPESLFNEEVETVVNEWFQILKSVNAVMFHCLKLECSNVFVNSLNL